MPNKGTYGLVFPHTELVSFTIGEAQTCTIPMWNCLSSGNRKLWRVHCEAQMRSSAIWSLKRGSTIITVRSEVAKVMFLHLSVILFTGGSASVHAGIPPPPPPRGQAPPPGTRHPPDQTPPGTRLPRPDTPLGQAPPGSRDGYCCGRYASYYNAFLLSEHDFIIFSWTCFPWRKVVRYTRPRCAREPSIRSTTRSSRSASANTCYREQNL